MAVLDFVSYKKGVTFSTRLRVLLNVMKIRLNFYEIFWMLDIWIGTIEENGCLYIIVLSFV